MTRSFTVKCANGGVARVDVTPADMDRRGVSCAERLARVELQSFAAWRKAQPDWDTFQEVHP